MVNAIAYLLLHTIVYRLFKLKLWLEVNISIIVYKLFKLKLWLEVKISMQKMRMCIIVRNNWHEINIAFQEILLAQGVMLALLSFFLFLSH